MELAHRHTPTVRSDEANWTKLFNFCVWKLFNVCIKYFHIISENDIKATFQIQYVSECDAVSYIVKFEQINFFFSKKE